MGNRMPFVIAAMVQENLRGISVLGSLVAREVRQTLGSDLVNQIEGALRIGWIDTSVDRSVFAAIAEHTGAEGVGLVMQRTIRAQMDRPLFRPMLELATHVHMLKLEPVLSLTCKCFNLVHRNNGTLSFDRRATGYELLLTDAEPSTAADSTYMLAFAIAFQTAIRIAKPGATVSVASTDAARRNVRFTAAI